MSQPAIDSDSSTQPEFFYAEILPKVRHNGYFILGYLFSQALTTGAPIYGWISAMQKLRLAPMMKETDPITGVVSYGPAAYTFLLFNLCLRASQVLAFPICFVSDIIGPRSSALAAEATLAIGLFVASYYVGGAPSWDDGSGNVGHEWFVWVICICWALAAPFQIVSAQMSMRTLFKKQLSDLSITLLNGCYDSSAIMFTLVGAALLADENDHSVPNAQSRAKSYTICLLVFGCWTVIQLPIILWLYPTEAEMIAQEAVEARPLALQPSPATERSYASLTNAQLANSEIERALTEPESERAGTIDRRSSELDRAQLSREQSRGSSVAPAENSDTFPNDASDDNDSDDVPDDSFFSPGRKSPDLSLIECLTDRDYICASIWFSCQFFTFTYFQEKSPNYFSSTVNDHVGFFYPFSMVTALIMGYLLTSKNVMFITSFMGIVFQTLVILASGGNITGGAGWILPPCLCLYRSGIFSSLWIYWPSIFNFTWLGAMYGLACGFTALLDYFLKSAILPSFPSPYSTEQGQKVNIVWGSTLLIVNIFYCAWIGLCDTMRRNKAATKAEARKARLQEARDNRHQAVAEVGAAKNRLILDTSV